MAVITDYRTGDRTENGADYRTDYRTGDRTGDRTDYWIDNEVQSFAVTFHHLLSFYNP